MQYNVLKIVIKDNIEHYAIIAEDSPGRPTFCGLDSSTPEFRELKDGDVRGEKCAPCLQGLNDGAPPDMNAGWGPTPVYNANPVVI